jgi:hypothetical protein
VRVLDKVKAGSLVVADELDDVAAGENGDVEDEAVLMESLDKPRIEDETISNRTGKKD